MSDVNYTALATAAAILRDEVTFADESAKLIVSAHFEAQEVTSLTMVDALDRLMESHPHLFWVAKPETTTAPALSTGPYTGLTARMIALKKSQQQ